MSRRGAERAEGNPLEEHIRSIVRDELARAKPVDEAPKLVTIATYAAARSISTSTVRQAIRRGRLAATHIGRAVRIKATDEIARGPRPLDGDEIDRAWDRSLGVGLRR